MHFIKRPMETQLQEFTWTGQHKWLKLHILNHMNFKNNITDYRAAVNWEQAMDDTIKEKNR